VTGVLASGSELLRGLVFRVLLLAWLVCGAAIPGVVLADEMVPPMPARVIAIGDLHGDLVAWRAIARDAGLIDAKGKWTGGATVLVQTGDVVDRGADSRAIIQDLMRLQKEAARSGGRVVALIGNHEAMNIIGDMRYVTPGEFAAFANGNSLRLRDMALEANSAAIIAAYREDKPDITDAEARAAWLAATPPGKLEHRAAWAPNGVIGKWVIGNPAVLRLGDTLFLHAGLSAAYAQRSPDEINVAVAKSLAAREQAVTAIINDPAGPLWYRGLAQADPTGSPESSADSELRNVLAAQGARRMVIGHTPNLSGVAFRHGDRLAMIDTGISAVYGGTLGYLEIVDGRWVAHAVARPASEQKGK
jgi:Calcineurin-like phosphoesterase